MPVASEPKNADLLITDAVIATPQGINAAHGQDMAKVLIIPKGALAIKDGSIVAVGTQHDVDMEYSASMAKQVISAHGKLVTPALVDSHTHPIWAGSRAVEFARRIGGVTYQQIMAEGGGIASTVRATRAAHNDELRDLTQARIQRMNEYGTGALEAKSGYGLSPAEEIRHLQILADIKKHSPSPVLITCLGAHALPPEYADNADGYIDLLIKELLPAVAPICDFVDVFCDAGAFTLKQAERILRAGSDLGMGLKIHADEFESLGAVGLACEMGALSADHLHCTTAEDIKRLANSNTVATILPSTSFFLREKEYSPARAMLNAGVAIALASDFNPGSCNCESLQAGLVIAALYLQMVPEEILTATTLNAAAALGIAEETGTLEKGKRADIAMWDVTELAELIQHWGVNHLGTLLLAGKIFV